MNEAFLAIVITALAVLFGLAWHNQPAREAVFDRGNQRKPQPHE
jgi:hypothetical protein